jgi:hypothetical protein
MKHELPISIDFLDTVQLTINTEKVVINALKLIPENKKIREICQLSLDLHGVDVMHVPKAEHRNAIGNLVDKCRPGKARETELKMTMLLDDKLSLKKKQINIQVNKYISEFRDDDKIRNYAKENYREDIVKI